MPRAELLTNCRGAGRFWLYLMVFAFSSTLTGWQPAAKSLRAQPAPQTAGGDGAIDRWLRSVPQHHVAPASFLDITPGRTRRDELQAWQVWGQACQLSGLSTQEEVQQWVERLLAVRENPDELAGVVALLMGYGEAELERLRGVLERVRLRVADVIRTGEAWVRNPRRTAKELLGFNDWVRRRRAVLRRQREERAGSDENRFDSS
ncbi:MAG: hypothetical protein KatS3mg110_3865 [Pirellulaceae bacterium]|nr:MAG: hypothetical protein KatS3mg110_3865 [Pirellulaceae bacterium]